MKILVTGGAGFIGSHVADIYIANGHDVVVVDNLSTGKRQNVNPKARFHEADIRDGTALERIFAAEQPQAINHQAALANVRESLQEPARYADVNVTGSIHLLEAARKHGVRKFVYASTGGASYGEPQSLPVDESHPVNPLDPYGASKHAVEHYLYLYEKLYGIGYTVLRYANVYGPRQDPFGEAGVIAIFTHKMLAGQQPTINGTGEKARDFVTVGDVARANLRALDGPDGFFNIGTGVPTTVNQVFQALKAATGYPHEAHYGPDKPGEVSRTFLNVGKAASGLGWQPEVDLAEGMRRTVASFRE